MNVPVVPSYCKPLKVRGVTVEAKYGCFLVVDVPGAAPPVYVSSSGVTVGGLDVDPLDSAAAIQVAPHKFTVAVAPGGGKLQVSHDGRALSPLGRFTIPKSGAMPAAFTALIAKNRPKVERAHRRRGRGGLRRQRSEGDLPPRAAAAVPRNVSVHR